MSVLREVASAFRAESANVGGPLQGSLMRLAIMLDAKAAELEPRNGLNYVPHVRGVDSPSEKAVTTYTLTVAKPESETVAPTDSDELEQDN